MIWPTVRSSPAARNARAWSSNAECAATICSAGPRTCKMRDAVGVGEHRHPLIGPVALGPFASSIGIDPDHRPRGQLASLAWGQTRQLVCDLTVQHDDVVLRQATQTR